MPSQRCAAYLSGKEGDERRCTKNAHGNRERGFCTRHQDIYECQTAEYKRATEEAESMRPDMDEVYLRDPIDGDKFVIEFDIETSRRYIELLERAISLRRRHHWQFFGGRECDSNQ